MDPVRHGHLRFGRGGHDGQWWLVLLADHWSLMSSIVSQLACE